jgi:GH15 family glucan-1,4-alpha-glucosidase
MSLPIDTSKVTSSKPLEDYALIGNMISAALVARDGSIDWLCLPRFDSAACFAALLGGPENGRWLIRPSDANAKVSRRYITDTAVLETRFETGGGVVTVTDFMPYTEDDEKINVMRIVQGVHGKVEMNMELILRFNYGQAPPWVRRRDYGLSAVAGPDAVELHTRVNLRGQDMKTLADFTVTEGDTVPFALSYHPSHKMPQFVPDSAESLGRTISWWREWSKRCQFKSDNVAWCEAVQRSLITLKLLVFRPTGGIIAAPTTSLPEVIGGKRNWDYRYCWIRDSALMLYALLSAGYRDEAEAWRQWLLRAAAGHPQQMHIMYGVAGERWLPENEVPWLPGYEASTPVRIGNGAAHQLQLDVYGELMDTLHAARDAQLASLDEAWGLQKELLAHLEKVWQRPDHGIWEVRGQPRTFTHSLLMCWVGFDRAVKSAEHFELDGPVDCWRRLRDEIHERICATCFNAERNTFVQYAGGQSLDASLLLMPQVGFIDAADQRFKGTVTAIERELMRDGLVRRYATEDVDDGVGGEEGVFLACSFWLVDAYIMLGRTADAKRMFETLLSLRNDVGLLAEEYDTPHRRLVGNFPQGFSHIGLINTAFNLIDAHGPAKQRSERQAPRNGGNPASPDAHSGLGLAMSNDRLHVGCNEGT